MALSVLQHCPIARSWCQMVLKFAQVTAQAVPGKGELLVFFLETAVVLPAEDNHGNFSLSTGKQLPVAMACAIPSWKSSLDVVWGRAFAMGFCPM